MRKDAEGDRMSERLIEGQEPDVGILREAIQEEYAEVASHPQKGFHFHTGRPLARMLEYANEWLEGIPESSIESFAGTGNPFSVGELLPGERVVDAGCGAGIDSMIAAKKVGPKGCVICGEGSKTLERRVPRGLCRSVAG